MGNMKKGGLFSPSGSTQPHEVESHHPVWRANTVVAIVALNAEKLRRFFDVDHFL
jgi:hypothetical protein